MGFEVTDIRGCWETIRPGLEVVRRKAAADWDLDEAFAKCVAGEWTLFTDGAVDGFLILCQYFDEGLGVRVLFVVAAYCRGADDPIAVHGPFLHALARRIGAGVIEFRSPRLGFQKKGWAVAEVVYRQEVRHG